MDDWASDRIKAFLMDLFKAVHTVPYPIRVNIASLSLLFFDLSASIACINSYWTVNQREIIGLLSFSACCFFSFFSPLHHRFVLFVINSFHRLGVLMLSSFLNVVAKSAHGGLIKKWGYTMTWIPFACHDYLINRVIISLKKAIELRQSLFLRSIGPFFCCCCCCWEMLS